jgi:hypothetical protein
VRPAVDDVDPVSVDVAVDQQAAPRAATVYLLVVFPAERQVVLRLTELIEEGSTSPAWERMVIVDWGLAAPDPCSGEPDHGFALSTGALKDLFTDTHFLTDA